MALNLSLYIMYFHYVLAHKYTLSTYGNTVALPTSDDIQM